MISRRIFCFTIILCTVVISRVESLTGQEGAVCHHNVSFPETIVVNITKPYRRKNCHYSTEKTCNGIQTVQENKTHFVEKEEEICCRGYNNNANPDQCEPICDPVCTNNSLCVKPNTCICKTGYEKSEDNKCRPVCTRSCKNGTCVAPNICACDKGFRSSQDDGFTCDPVCNNCVNGTCVAPNECACDDDFVNDESDIGACIPICDPKCIHGVCAVGGCNCPDGWKGDSCDEPLLCILDQPLLATSTEVMRLSTNSDNESSKYGWTDYSTENSSIEWDWPVCRSECLDQLNATNVNFTQISADAIHHFIPIDSPCNIVMEHSSSGFIKTNAMPLIVGSGIGLFFIIILVGYIAKRKMQTKSYKPSIQLQPLDKNDASLYT